MCFSCGEKFAAGHVCSKTAATPVLNSIDGSLSGEEILSNELLDAVETQEVALASMQLSACALSGTEGPTTLRLRAHTGN